MTPQIDKLIKTGHKATDGRWYVSTYAEHTFPLRLCTEKEATFLNALVALEIEIHEAAA